MSQKANVLLAEVLKLPVVERAELLDGIFASFEKGNDRQAIDAAWAVEAEERLEAFDRGEIESRPLDEVYTANNDGKRRAGAFCLRNSRR